jgi:hypothetical protein
MMLTDSLPSSVQIGGREYPVETDFRAGVKFEALMYEDIPDEEKVARAIGIYFEQPPHEPIDDVVDAILDFYRCGKPPVSVGSSQQVYSFSYDWDAIYASFLAAYGIDLLDVEYLHWYKFRSMLLALPKDSALMEIIGWRVAKPSRDMSREYRNHMAQMKALHALPKAKGLRRRFANHKEYRAWVEANMNSAAPSADGS